ncbi:MAG: Rrf2 family transcriptional regulator [Candidatus Sumerlaeia bacterium]|nr:Rrf2 family transcriptional regulator [Candidatus Sumerlaeia bacterium]
MLSKTSTHAAKALILLARLPEGAYAGAAALAEEISAPRNYLGKMLQTLARSGLLVSQKGLNGGFRLARPAKKITLFDIVEPFDHVSHWSGCLLSRKACSLDSPCAAHSRWGPVRDSYLEFLHGVTLEDLAQPQGKPSRRR